MEWRLNLLMGAVLVAILVARQARDPAPILPLPAPQAGALASLEDTVARHPTDAGALSALTRTYLELDRPGLAVAVLRSAPPRLQARPLLAHRLAEAYEASGRLADALATADVALARCERTLGARPSPAPPEPGAAGSACDLGLRAALEMHRRALAHMTTWGVTDPRHDPRARLAYDLALRRARIASVSE